MIINVRQVLQEAVVFYKDNFKRVAGVSLAIVVLPLLLLTSLIIGPSFGYLSALWQILLLCVTYLILFFAFIPRSILTMSLLIDSLLDNNGMKTREAYRKAKHKSFTYIGCLTRVALLYAPASAVLYTFEVPFASVIAALLALVADSFYYPMAPMVAVEHRIGYYLRKSAYLVKGNFKSILALKFITETMVTLLTIAVVTIFEGSTTGLFVTGVMLSLVSFFVFPFAATVSMIVYRRLTEEKGLPELTRPWDAHSQRDPTPLNQPLLNPPKQPES
jgi:hypothetical protein